MKTESLQNTARSESERRRLTTEELSTGLVDPRRLVPWKTLRKAEEEIKELRSQVETRSPKSVPPLVSQNMNKVKTLEEILEERFQSLLKLARYYVHNEGTDEKKAALLDLLPEEDKIRLVTMVRVLEMVRDGELDNLESLDLPE